MSNCSKSLNRKAKEEAETKNDRASKKWRSITGQEKLSDAY